VATLADAARAQDSLQPHGGRIGVAFDWGLGVQLAVTGAAALAGVQIDALPMPPLVGAALVGVSALAFAQGEALRRGYGWARWVQLGANSLVTLGALAGLPILVRGLQQGHYAMLYSYAIMLIVLPAEVWLLLQPGSRRWYGHVDPAAARARHSGRWLTGTVAWAVVCGLLQVLAASASPF
jgi:hypothetical protein